MYLIVPTDGKPETREKLSDAIQKFQTKGVSADEAKMNPFVFLTSRVGALGPTSDQNNFLNLIN